MRRLLWRPALAVLLGVLALGGKCRLGLQDTATGPARPKRFCKTLEFEYRRPRPPDKPREFWACLVATLIELRPGQGEVKTELFYDLGDCLYSTSPGIVQVGPDRWRFTFRDVYMPYPDEFGNVLRIEDSALTEWAAVDGVVLPPEVSDARRSLYKGVPAIIFYLKEEGTCVGG